MSSSLQIDSHRLEHEINNMMVKLKLYPKYLDSKNETKSFYLKKLKELEDCICLQKEELELVRTKEV